MAHTKATPENQRPTLDEIRERVYFAGKDTVVYKVEALWEAFQGVQAEFCVQISGHPADVDEVIGSLRDNGNLHNVVATQMRGNNDR